MDLISKEHRSWNMSRISSKNTSPEKIVRSHLHHLGYRFRLHRKDLPGKPDIVLPRLHAVIFVNGCFWHRHAGCKFAYTPKTRVGFWLRKFNENVLRDKIVQKSLRRQGWHVLIVWECQVPRKHKIVARLARFLENI